MPYFAEFHVRRPGLLVILVEQSGAMARPYTASRDIHSKAAFAADCVNRLLLELVLRCSRGDEVCHWFDVAVLAYGGRDGAKPALLGQLRQYPTVAVTELAYKPGRVETCVKEFDDAGGIIEQEVELPIWIDPVADGSGSMRSGLAGARTVIANWIAQHRDSFPPVVFHVTGGDSTDADAQAEAAALRALGTDDGNVLLFNFHLSSTYQSAVIFPERQADIPGGAAAGLLFSMSSLLPTRSTFLFESGRSERARAYQFNPDHRDMRAAMDPDVGSGRASRADWV